MPILRLLQFPVAFGRPRRQQARLRQATLALGTLILLSGCSGLKQNTLETLPEKVPPTVLVFVPGYKGSALRDKHTKERVWITAREELFGTRSLALNAGAFGEAPSLELEPEEPLGAVRVFPPFWVVDVYAKWLGDLRRALPDNTLLVSFAYDWRDDNLLAAAKLGAAVAELRHRGAKQIILVAHSMGSLPVSYFLRYGTANLSEATENWAGADQVAGVAFVGPPFLGVAYTFRNMQIGARNRYNTALLNQFSVSSFPAAFQLMPPVEVSMLQSRSGESLQSLVYDSQSWVDNGWGLFRSGPTPANAEFRKAFINEQLSRAQSLHRRLFAPLGQNPTRPIPVLNVRGSGHDTLAHMLLLEQGLAVDEASLRELDPTISPSRFYQRGDGVVTNESSKLPPAFEQIGPVTEVFSSAVHDRLGVDPVVRKALAQWISALIERGAGARGR